MCAYSWPSSNVKIFSNIAPRLVNYSANLNWLCLLHLPCWAQGMLVQATWLSIFVKFSYTLSWLRCFTKSQIPLRKVCNCRVSVTLYTLKLWILKLLETTAKRHISLNFGKCTKTQILTSIVSFAPLHKHLVKSFKIFKMLLLH